LLVKELIRSHVQKCLDKLNQTIEEKAENPSELANAREIMKILRERYQLAIENQCKEMEVLRHTTVPE
jgi:flagellar biosynthesis chaperone FliJ